MSNLDIQNKTHNLDESPETNLKNVFSSDSFSKNILDLEEDLKDIDLNKDISITYPQVSVEQKFVDLPLPIHNQTENKNTKPYLVVEDKGEKKD